MYSQLYIFFFKTETCILMHQVDDTLLVRVLLDTVCVALYVTKFIF